VLGTLVFVPQVGLVGFKEVFKAVRARDAKGVKLIFFRVIIQNDDGQVVDGRVCLLDHFAVFFGIVYGVVGAAFDQTLAQGTLFVIFTVVVDNGDVLIGIGHLVRTDDRVSDDRLAWSHPAFDFVRFVQSFDVTAGYLFIHIDDKTRGRRMGIVEDIGGLFGDVF